MVLVYLKQELSQAQVTEVWTMQGSRGGCSKMCT